MSPGITTYLHAGLVNERSNSENRELCFQVQQLAARREKESDLSTPRQCVWVGGFKYLSQLTIPPPPPPYPRKELSNPLLPAPSSVTMLLHVLMSWGNPIQLHQQIPCLELTRILQVGTELHSIQAWLFSILIALCAPQSCLPWPFLLGRRGQCRDVTSPHRLESRSPAVPWVRSGKLQQASPFLSLCLPVPSHAANSVPFPRFALLISPSWSVPRRPWLSLLPTVSVPENFDGKIANT